MSPVSLCHASAGIASGNSGGFLGFPWGGRSPQALSTPRDRRVWLLLHPQQFKVQPFGPQLWV